MQWAIKHVMRRPFLSPSTSAVYHSSHLHLEEDWLQGEHEYALSLPPSLTYKQVINMHKLTWMNPLSSFHETLKWHEKYIYTSKAWVNNKMWAPEMTDCMLLCVLGIRPCSTFCGFCHSSRWKPVCHRWTALPCICVWIGECDMCCKAPWVVNKTRKSLYKLQSVYHLSQPGS